MLLNRNSPSIMKGSFGPKGEPGGCRRRTVQVLPGLHGRNKRLWGWQGWSSRQRPIGCGWKACSLVHFRRNPDSPPDGGGDHDGAVLVCPDEGVW